MFAMIFVNDLAGVSDRIVPPWMKHFRGQSGMTFVDLVFPAFLFIVGMSIPLALRARADKGGPRLKTFLHVLVRTLSLLFIGILMVNGTPDSERMGILPSTSPDHPCLRARGSKPSPLIRVLRIRGSSAEISTRFRGPL